ncbi:MAG: sensor histidine kinase [Desulfobacterales bacterium]
MQNTIIRSDRKREPMPERPRLLFVDDNEAWLQSIQRFCAGRGYPSLAAPGPAEGLDLLAREEVDVAVVDMKMPGGSGLELLRRIKECSADMEVILLTGHANMTDAVEGMKAGAFDYLSKPVEPGYLLEKIRQAYDRKRMEAENLRQAEFRREMERQLSRCERLASLGTMVAGVAHEINNPLSIINESADWLKRLLAKDALRDIPMRPEFDRVLEKIETGVRRIRTITHDLLCSLGNDKRVIQEVGIDRLLSEALSAVGQHVASRNARIEVTGADTSGSIWTDPGRLRQVLVNLLTNALDAIESGGRVRVSAKRSGNGIVVEIFDDGAGIPKELLDRIFEPFFTTKTPGRGTGLGLYLSLRIVEELGGVIEVESTIGRGSTFRIRLPASPAGNGSGDLAPERKNHPLNQGDNR